MTAGKGSAPRPKSVDADEFAKRWDAIFKPMTDDEIDAGMGHETLEYRRGFNDGVRHAELTHKPK